MAETNLLKRYLDAGLAFTQLTQARAEAIVKDLVKAGEVQTEQAQAAVNELIERSRKNTDQLFGQIRRDVREQVSNLGLATKADIARLERRISALQSPGRATKAGAKKSSTGRGAAKKSSKRAPSRAAAKKTKKASG